MQKSLLARMEELLSHGGMNYSTFLRAYSVDDCSGLELEEIARQAIGENVSIDSIRDVSFADIDLDLRECLGYEGDVSAGPKNGITRAREFLDLLENICKDVRAESERSCVLKSFRFQEGHPAYPVFWDFSYAFFAEDECQILVCSSSD